MNLYDCWSKNDWYYISIYYIELQESYINYPRIILSSYFSPDNVTLPDDFFWFITTILRAL